jgi:hypothetical protein
VTARDGLAQAIAAVKADILGQTVTCYGKVETRSFDKPKPDGGVTTISYQVLTLERIATADLILPVPDRPEAAGGPDTEPTANPSAPLDPEIAGLDF